MVDMLLQRTAYPKIYVTICDCLLREFYVIRMVDGCFSDSRTVGHFRVSCRVCRMWNVGQR